MTSVWREERGSTRWRWRRQRQCARQKGRHERNSHLFSAFFRPFPTPPRFSNSRALLCDSSIVSPSTETARAPLSGMSTFIEMTLPPPSRSRNNLASSPPHDSRLRSSPSSHTGSTTPPPLPPAGHTHAPSPFPQLDLLITRSIVRHSHPPDRYDRPFLLALLSRVAFLPC